MNFKCPLLLVAFPLLACLAEEIECPVVADNSIASFPTELTENTGSAAQVKIKGRENQPLFKFDLSKLPKDKGVAKAVLRFKLHEPGYRLNQVAYSTVPADWVEGQGAKPEETEHAFSCHKWAGPSSKKWGAAGEDILEVIHGNGGNVNGVAFAKEVDGWWEVEIPGRAVEALRADQPGGLILMDETGWWPGKWANIYILSRESKTPPVLKITVGEADAAAPGAPKIACVDGELDDGELLLEITASGDDGEQGTALGYEIRILQGEGKVSAENWEQAKPLARERTPRPGQPGTRERRWIKGLEAGKPYALGIVAYDECGNRSPVASSEVRKATGPLAPPRLQLADAMLPAGAPRKAGETLQLWAVDEMTKLDPVSGQALDGETYADSKYREHSTVYDGQAQKVVLHAAKGEIAAFRLAFENIGGAEIKTITLKAQDLKGPEDALISAGNLRFRRQWYLKAKDRWYGSALPPLDGKNNGAFDLPALDNQIEGQKVQEILADVIVPKDAKPGVYAGAIEFSVGGEKKGEMPVEIHVANVSMPADLSFLIELNAYGQRDKDQFHTIHRLAHYFRLGYNALGYGHSGSRSLPCIPDIEGTGAEAKVKDWAAWDEWMGPLLDGSLFADLPRARQPIPHYYLPFYENYPISIYDNYLDGKMFLDRHLEPGKAYDYKEWLHYVCLHDIWVGDAFSENWKKGSDAVARQFRAHFEEKGWNKTQFQIFLNNKNSKGRSKPGQKGTSLWTLDEPSFGRDFRALNFVYMATAPAFEDSKLRWVVRADVSRPEWQGDRMDECLAHGLSVVSRAFFGNQLLIQRRRMERGDRYWFYGGGRGADADATQLAAQYLKAWSMGAEGGLAYWTSFHGGASGWDELDPLAHVLSANHGYEDKAVPDWAITTSRRVQQDIELLNMLARKPGWSHRRAAQALAAAVNLESKNEGDANPDDPGTATFGAIRAADLMKIRHALLKALAE